MPALNFKSQFADDVESGKKRQTIRPIRKRPIKVGDDLHLYTGMRTKICRKLGMGICGSVMPVRIDAKQKRVVLNGMPLWFHHEIDELARADGFASIGEFFDFFKRQYGEVFEGVLIKW